MRGRYSAFVSIVASRLRTVGRDPAAVLIASPELFELAAVTVPGQPVMFAMYVETALARSGPLEHLADQFVAGWLRQVAIDEAGYAEFKHRHRYPLEHT
jgi:hypothetical protein